MEIIENNLDTIHIDEYIKIKNSSECVLKVNIKNEQRKENETFFLKKIDTENPGKFFKRIITFSILEKIGINIPEIKIGKCNIKNIDDNNGNADNKENYYIFSKECEGESLELGKFNFCDKNEELNDLSKKELSKIIFCSDLLGLADIANDNIIISKDSKFTLIDFEPINIIGKQKENYTEVATNKSDYNLYESFIVHNKKLNFIKKDEKDNKICVGEKIFMFEEIEKKEGNILNDKLILTLEEKNNIYESFLKLDIEKIIEEGKKIFTESFLNCEKSVNFEEIELIKNIYKGKQENLLKSGLIKNKEGSSEVKYSNDTPDTGISKNSDNLEYLSKSLSEAGEEISSVMLEPSEGLASDF